jgi:hypothetical protein
VYQCHGSTRVGATLAPGNVVPCTCALLACGCYNLVSDAGRSRVYQGTIHGYVVLFNRVHVYHPQQWYHTMPPVLEYVEVVV